MKRLQIAGGALPFICLPWLMHMAPALAGEPRHPRPRPGLYAAIFPDESAKELRKMKPEQISAFARLALKGIQKEYPNKPGHVLNGDMDARTPRALHPAFYGCYDWHSSVHGHWMLVRLLRQFPDLPEKQQIRKALGENLTAKNLHIEAEYFTQPNRKSFERTYGWAWLLKLAEELHGWDDADAKEWSRNLKPLADTLIASYIAFLPKQTYPIRSGVHPNTAFGLTFALDYARAVDHKQLREVLEERSRAYYGKDVNVPAELGAGRRGLLLAEPDGSRPDAAGAAGRGVSRLVQTLPARPGPRRAEIAADAGDGGRPHRPADRPPGRPEPEPGLVHAQHRLRPAEDRPGPQGSGRGGRAARGRRPAPRDQRRLCGRTLAGIIRGVHAFDAVA